LTDTANVTSWTIVGGPEEDLYPPGGKDAVIWTWEIERDGERRTIQIVMSRTLLAATAHPSDDAATARETKGRNYVEAVLDRADPPRSREANTGHSLVDTLLDSHEYV
jgi:hypothetical protein